jgi:hypothetical protein
VLAESQVTVGVVWGGEQVAAALPVMGARMRRQQAAFASTWGAPSQSNCAGATRNPHSSPASASESALPVRRCIPTSLGMSLRGPSHQLPVR